MHPARAPEPQPGSTSIAISRLVLAAAFLACGANGNPGVEAGAFPLPAPTNADSTAAPTASGTPDTMATEVGSAATGAGASSPAGSSEVPGSIGTGTPLAGNDTPGSDTPDSDPPDSDPPGSD